MNKYLKPLSTILGTSLLISSPVLAQKYEKMDTKPYILNGLDPDSNMTVILDQFTQNRIDFPEDLKENAKLVFDYFRDNTKFWDAPDSMELMLPGGSVLLKYINAYKNIDVIADNVIIKFTEDSIPKYMWDMAERKMAFGERREGIIDIFSFDKPFIGQELANYFYKEASDSIINLIDKKKTFMKGKGHRD